MQQINIIGKDYLTETEAAFYACMSLSHWKKKSKELNLSSFEFLGKKLYRKADIVREIESAWQRSVGAASVEIEPSLTGVRTASNAASRSAKSARTKPKQSGWKKNSNYAQATAAQR